MRLNELKYRAWFFCTIIIELLINTVPPASDGIYWQGGCGRALSHGLTPYPLIYGPFWTEKKPLLYTIY